MARASEIASRAVEVATKVRGQPRGVDAGELNDILATACVVRNGWKVILGRCAASQNRESCSADHMPARFGRPSRRKSIYHGSL